MSSIGKWDRLLLVSLINMICFLFTDCNSGLKLLMNPGKWYITKVIKIGRINGDLWIQAGI